MEIRGAGAVVCGGTAASCVPGGTSLAIAKSISAAGNPESGSPISFTNRNFTTGVTAAGGVAIVTPVIVAVMVAAVPTLIAVTRAAGSGGARRTGRPGSTRGASPSRTARAARQEQDYQRSEQTYPCAHATPHCHIHATAATQVRPVRGCEHENQRHGLTAIKFHRRGDGTFTAGADFSVPMTMQTE